MGISKGTASSIQREQNLTSTSPSSSTYEKGDRQKRELFLFAQQAARHTLLLTSCQQQLCLVKLFQRSENSVRKIIFEGKVQ